MVSKGLSRPGCLSRSGTAGLPGAAATGVSWTGAQKAGWLVSRGWSRGCPQCPVVLRRQGCGRCTCSRSDVTASFRSAAQKSPWQPREHRLCHWLGPAALKSESKGVTGGEGSATGLQKHPPFCSEKMDDSRGEGTEKIQEKPGTFGGAGGQKVRKCSKKDENRWKDREPA